MRLLITEPFNEEVPTGLVIEQREWNDEAGKWILLALSMNGEFKDDRGLQRENKTKLFSLLQKGSQPSQHLDFSQVPGQFHISDSLESQNNKSGLL